MARPRVPLTLDIASWTIRSAATSTAAGSAGSCCGRLDADAQVAAARVLLHAIADRADEAELVERRWPQARHEPPDVHDRLLGLLAHPLEQLLDRRWIAVEQVARGVERQRQRRQ